MLQIWKRADPCLGNQKPNCIAQLTVNISDSKNLVVVFLKLES